MPLKLNLLGLIFCCFFVISYFTNKYVLSVLKFTFPTVFQGWADLRWGLAAPGFLESLDWLK
uniref:Uncharacterized protein n=1 Tax=Anguilla anguilla TaxID=7936 RepID=A0A0E9PL13_ANGAN